MKPTKPVICQVVNPEVYLPCDKQVGEFRCEKIEQHNEDHWVGEHTILHAIAGVHASCDSIEGHKTSKVKPTKAKKEKSAASSEPLSKKKLVILFSSAIVLPVTLALVWQFLLVPLLNDGDGFSSVNGDIVASNTELVVFSGQEIDSANVDQKALALDGKATTPPAFIFTNGEEVEGRKVLNLYADFGDQDSRDLFLLNQVTLQALVENGRIELRIHPVASGNAFSVYSAEALAEAFYYAPEKAWDFLSAVLKFEVEGQGQGLNADELAEAIAKVADDSGIEGIDGDSIQNGTFVSWILSLSSDPRLSTGGSVPAVYLDDKLVKLDGVDITKSVDFNKYLEED